MNHHQDSNNNVAYFDITANFENINDESTAETVDLRRKHKTEKLF